MNREVPKTNWLTMQSGVAGSTPVTAEWLCEQLKAGAAMVVVDTRSPSDYRDRRVRRSLHVSYPTIVLRRVAAGKMDALSALKSRDIRDRLLGVTNSGDDNASIVVMYGEGDGSTSPDPLAVLAARLIDAGRRVFVLKGGFSTFASHYPEWVDAGNENGTSAPMTDNNAADEASSDGVGESSLLSLASLSSLRISNVGTVAGSAGSSAASSASDDDSQYHTATLCCERHHHLHHVHHHHHLMPHHHLHHLHHHKGRSREPSDSSAPSDADDQSEACTADTCEDAPSSCEMSTPLRSGEDYGTGNSQGCESGMIVEIMPRLFLGNAQNSEDRQSLDKHDIKYILNVTPDLPNVFEDIQYLQIPIADHWTQNLASFFPQAIHFIDEARRENKGVLVHCLAGVSRSVTVTMAYLMYKQSMSLNEAYEFVRSRKQDIAPNFTFLGQLLDFERQLLGGDTERLGSASSLPPNSSSSSCPRCCWSRLGSGSSSDAPGVPTPLSSDSAISSASAPLSSLPPHLHPHGGHHCSMRHLPPCNCGGTPLSSSSSVSSNLLSSPLNMGASPDSGIEFDRWGQASHSTSASALPPVTTSAD